MEPRAYESGAAGTPPAYPVDSVAGYPLASTTVLPATIPGPYWFHMMGEEVRNVLVQTGHPPDPYDSTQLFQSIMSIINART